MTPTMLRQLWSLVEMNQATLLLNLDDASLVQWLLKQFRAEQSLNAEEASMVGHYIQSKIPLIRDLAGQRIPHMALSRSV
ncbi:hypothetical protein [Alkalinema sp. FACHB-956]|uniref:hypothetical protein n=1 Tax=Alkalinema sp. FACHB-956 TaxID=2692768 RepID=UPI0016875180|nr:hypothetical protein [Alkalinema sp. FACHB-956]MBD2327285.1 hypothetical protein [Alkalinema sp. FACHB-956]